MNRRTTRGIWRVHTVFVVCLVIFVGGCATTTFVPPENVDVGALRERAESAIQNDIRVSAAIPSRKNSIAIFGIDLSEKKIQPVWLEIENNSDRPVYFLRTGLDPEYFSPREVAFAFFESMSDDDKQRLIQHIESLNFRDPVAPHSSVSGFIFTNEDRETKFVTVDLLSPDSSSHLTLLVSIPERSLTEGHVAKIYAMIAETEPIRVEDESRLRSLLEKLPCCAASEDGVQGEPLNVVLIGDLDAAVPALARRHFRYTPVSPLYVFGRPQDISLRKMGRWVAEQPHVPRAWLTKIRFRGKLVWIGQINMPKGGRFADASSDGSRLCKNVT